MIPFATIASTTFQPTPKPLLKNASRQWDAKVYSEADLILIEQTGEHWLQCLLADDMRQKAFVNNVLVLACSARTEDFEKAV